MAHRDRFGWAVPKVDELLVPVLRAYDTRQTQLRIDQFLSFNQRFAKIKSKRLQVGVCLCLASVMFVHHSGPCPLFVACVLAHQYGT